MEEKQTLKKVVDAAVQEPIGFRIHIKPKNKFHRWLQSKGIVPATKHFEISPLSLGTCMRISKILVDVQMMNRGTMDEIIASFQNNSERLAEIVAIAVVNSKTLPSQKLVHFFLYKLSPDELKSLVEIVIDQMKLEAFMITIVSVKGLNVLQTTSPNELRETIARGASLEQL